MQNGIHFISGLPRAGSTLLAALLRQNPKLCSGITSPVGGLVATMLPALSQGNESAIFIDDAQRAALIRALFDGFYHAIHPTRTVFDVNRGWTMRLELLASLFPQSKMICCVRQIPWIIDSVERLIRKNKFELSKIFGFDAGATVYSRAESMMSAGGLIGYPLASLKQAMHSSESHRLLLLPYDTLVSDPKFALSAVYEFAGLPGFEHGFENVAFDEKEFDARLGTPGLHEVRPRVEREERETILPPDVWGRYENTHIWRDPAFNTRSVRIADKPVSP
jgi:sulfotransferase